MQYLHLVPSSFVYILVALGQYFDSVQPMSCVSAVRPALCPEQRGRAEYRVLFIHSANICWMSHARRCRKGAEHTPILA